MSIEDVKVAAVPNGFGIKEVTGYKTCDYCKEKYEIRTYDIEYKIKLKGKTYHFCSWTHKCRFRDLHKEELEKENEKKDWVRNYFSTRKDMNERTKTRLRETTPNFRILERMNRFKNKYPEVNFLTLKEYKDSVLEKGKKYIVSYTNSNSCIVINEKGEKDKFGGFKNALKWLGVEVKK